MSQFRVPPPRAGECGSCYACYSVSVTHSLNMPLYRIIINSPEIEITWISWKTPFHPFLNRNHNEPDKCLLNLGINDTYQTVRKFWTFDWQKRHIYIEFTYTRSNLNILLFLSNHLLQVDLSNSNFDWWGRREDKHFDYTGLIKGRRFQMRETVRQDNL